MASGEVVLQVMVTARGRRGGSGEVRGAPGDGGQRLAGVGRRGQRDRADPDPDRRGKRRGSWGSGGERVAIVREQWGSTGLVFPSVGGL